MEEKTYQVNASCENCKWHGTQDIPKGSSVRELIARDCPMCGCRGMKLLCISKETHCSYEEGHTGKKVSKLSLPYFGIPFYHNNWNSEF